MGKITSRLPVLLALAAICCHCSPDKSSAPLSLKMEKDSLHPDIPILVVENAHYRISFNTRERVIHKFGPLDYCIRDWVLKEKMQDQIDVCLDGSALRPNCSEIHILKDGKKEKVVQLFYGTDKNFEQHYTFHRDQPYIRIDYVRYPTDWFNTVDIGSPGGILKRFEAKTLVYGEEDWIRNKVYHEGAFWNIHLDESKEIYMESDEGKSGPILYRGHFIMLVGDPQSGVGFGRIMPMWTEDKGGIRILKLLWDLGFETFPGSGDQEIDDLKPFTGFVFLYSEGMSKALGDAKHLIDTRTIDRKPG